MVVPDARARPHDRHGHVRQRRVGPRTSTSATWRSPRTSRCARRRRSTTRACTATRSRDRPDAAGVAAAAAAARDRRRSSSARVYRAAGEGYEVGGDFYDVFIDLRGPVVRRGRRRLRQGRRGRGRDGDGALHDPRRGGAAALAGGDPALGQRGDDAPGASSTAASARSPACTSTSRARPRGVTVACGGHPLPLHPARRRPRRGGRGAGTLLGLVERPELETLPRAAAGRHDRALHGRAHRGGGAGRHLDAEELARCCAAPRGAPRRSWTSVREALGPARAARRHRRRRAARAQLISRRSGVARGRAVVAAAASSGGSSPPSPESGALAVARDLVRLLLGVALGPPGSSIRSCARGPRPLRPCGRRASRARRPARPWPRPCAPRWRPSRRSEGSSARSPAAFLTRPVILSVMPMVGLRSGLPRATRAGPETVSRRARRPCAAARARAGSGARRASGRRRRARRSRPG